MSFRLTASEENREKRVTSDTKLPYSFAPDFKSKNPHKHITDSDSNTKSSSGKHKVFLIIDLTYCLRPRLFFFKYCPYICSKMTNENFRISETSELPGRIKAVHLPSH